VSGSGLLDRVALGDHVCWIVDDDRFRADTIAGFLMAGLRARQRVIYSGDDPETVLAALRERGADPAGPLRSGSLMADTPEATYLAPGYFDPEAVLTGWRAEIDRARRDGYLGVRVVGDMSWAARRVPGTERLDWYEANVNTVLSDGYAAGVCAYDRRLFDPLDLREYNWAHPGAVTAGMPYDPDTSLRIRRTGSGLVLSGEADRSNRVALSAVVDQLIDVAAGREEMLVDVSGLRFADTAVARILVQAARHGRVRVTGCSPALRRLLGFTGAAEEPQLIVDGPR
jgi:anti-anti-sigma regulatory factor